MACAREAVEPAQLECTARKMQVAETVQQERAARERAAAATAMQEQLVRQREAAAKAEQDHIAREQDGSARKVQKHADLAVAEIRRLENQPLAKERTGAVATEVWRIQPIATAQVEVERVAERQCAATTAPLFETNEQERLAKVREAELKAEESRVAAQVRI